MKIFKIFEIPSFQNDTLENFERIELQQKDIENLISENNVLRRAIAKPSGIHDKWVDPSVNYLYNRLISQIRAYEKKQKIYDIMLPGVMRHVIEKDLTPDQARKFAVKNFSPDVIIARIRDLHDENIKLEQYSQSIPAIRAEMHCKNKVLYDENLKLRRDIERCRKLIGEQKKGTPDLFDIDTTKTSDNVSSTDNALYQKLLNLQNTLTNNQTIIEKQRRSQFQRDQAYGKLKSELDVLQDKLEHAYSVIQNLEEVSARERKKYEEKISSESKISKFKTQRTEMFLTELLRIFPSTKDFVRDFFNTDFQEF